MSADQAVVIATRNRTDDLERTLHSMESQRGADERRVFLVDGSDDGLATERTRAVLAKSPLPTEYLRYTGVPSAARQRNYGLERLPSSVRHVFFLDDDIALHSDCLFLMSKTLNEHPGIDGVGAIEHAPSQTATPSKSALWRYAFLLDHPEPGRVLPSGHVSLYNSIPEERGITPVEWLSTCCCVYRHDAIRTMRFATNLGRALYEDRDFAYRVAQSGTLAIVPTAHYTHHFSPVNRNAVARHIRDSICVRYRFVQQRIRHPLRVPAFWWATFGKLVALATSTKPSKYEALRGHLQGIMAVLRE